MIEDTVACFLDSLRRKGVSLWHRDGELRYRAPKGVLDGKEIERLGALSAEILALLQRATDATSAALQPTAPPRSFEAPMSFSQRAHWNLYQLDGRRSLRQVACAVRLSGHLSVSALQRSVDEIVRRHDALRTRIVVRDSGPVQEIAPAGVCRLQVKDLTGWPENSRDAGIRTLIDQFILEPVDVSRDALLGITLLHCREDEHVLIAAMEHMISDAFSLNILLREIFTAYAQALRGLPISLPAVQVQFPDYAVRQQDARMSWVEAHGAYWHEHFAGCKPLSGPVDKIHPVGMLSGWATVRFHIDAELKAGLRAWCRSMRTTLAMGVLTAYVGSVLRWYGTSEAVIQYQTDGRGSSRLESTIGYLASALYLRIRHSAEDGFAALLAQVTEEFCNAYQHADSYYFAAQTPSPDFVRAPLFNWVPMGAGTGLSELAGSEDALTGSLLDFPHPMLEQLKSAQEPVMLLYDVDDRIVGDMLYSCGRYSHSAIDLFVNSFLQNIMHFIGKSADCAATHAVMGRFEREFS
jgi:hypothetical protein